MGTHQAIVDVAEAVRGYRYVLRWYLDVAVHFGPLAVQAGPRPGGDQRFVVGPQLEGSALDAGAEMFDT